MGYVFSVYLLPNFVAGVVALLVAALAWQHRDERTARPFIILMLSIAMWTFSYGIELGQTTVAGVIFWDQIAFIPSVIVPPAIFMMGVEYAGFDDRLPWWAPLALLVIPAITLVFVFQYPASRLVWESVGMERTGAITVPLFEFGNWYWVYLTYGYLLIGVALSLFGYVFVRGSRIYRRQSALLIIGAGVPLGANLVYNVLPISGTMAEIDFTTFALVATGILYGIALYRFRMLDYAPKARGILLGRVGDGFLMYDTSGELVEMNDIGESAYNQDIVPREGNGHDSPNLGDLDGEVVSVRIEGTERVYELLTEEVIDFRDEHVGTLLVLRDITELNVLRQQEQRLSVLNRILRHNIRNEMNIVGGIGRDLEAELEESYQTKAAAVVKSAERMVSIGEKTRRISTDLNAYQRRRSVEIVPIIRAVGEWAGSEYPNASFDLSVEGSVLARVTAEEDLETALRYLVENAVEHSDSRHPQVEIRLDEKPDEVIISVSDDGPGLPAQERDVLDSDREVPLQHGSGLGLWVANWLIEQSNGRMSFQQNDPEGTIVRIHLSKGSQSGDSPDELSPTF